MVEIFYQIFGNQDWAYYFLSQIFVVTTFYVVWLLSKEFFQDKIYSLISVFLLEGIFFYNFTSPEFNVNVCQLPFWALSALYFWRGFKNNKIIDWLLFGTFAALGILSKYLFIYLLISLVIFFCFTSFKKKINFKSFISLIPFFLILFPHIIWLVENNYITMTYGLHRTGAEDKILLDHLFKPFFFLVKQFGILIPFFVMFLFLLSKFKININPKDKKFLFLLSITIVPIILIFLTSLIIGVKIRTMWMTPFLFIFWQSCLFICFKFKN